MLVFEPKEKEDYVKLFIRWLQGTHETNREGERLKGLLMLSGEVRRDVKCRVAVY